MARTAARLFVVGVLLTIAAAALAGPAASRRPSLFDRGDPCGCNPVLVGYGHSRGGQEWSQRYAMYRGQSYLTMSLPDGHGGDGGGGSSWPGFNRRFQFQVSYGDGFAAPDPFMVYGATARAVRTIKFVFSDRAPLSIHPRLASARLRGRFPFLHDVRFYSVFFGGGERVKRITLYAGDGRKLQTVHMTSA